MVRMPLRAMRGRAPAAAKSVLLFAGAAAVCAAALFGCSRTLGEVHGLVATPQSSSLVLSWHAVPDASGYALFVSTSPDLSPSNYQITETTTGTTETVSGLTAGTTYYCIVLATSAYGFNEGPYGQVTTVTVGGSGSSSNQAPIITALTVWPQPVALSRSALFVASATDSDGDTLTYSWTVDGAALSATTSQVFWTPTAAGTHTVAVAVSDGVNPPVTSQMTFSVQ